MRAFFAILFAAVSGLATVLSAGDVKAQPLAHEEAPKVVRIGLSSQAAASLNEVRVRRLIELELGNAAMLPSDAAGPLDENAVRVFIDLPDPTIVTIQVQAPGRRLEVRRVDVAGLAWDVATRFIAIATSESVRAHLAPLRKRRPRAPTDDEIVAMVRGVPALDVRSTLHGAYLTGAGQVLLGSRFELGFHQPLLSEHVSVGALGGTDGARWIEGQVSASHRLWITPGVRADLGLGFALAYANGVSLVDVADFDASADEARALIRVVPRMALELLLDDGAWFMFGLEPALVYDPAPRDVGAWIGLSMAFAHETFLEAVPQVRPR